MHRFVPVFTSIVLVAAAMPAETPDSAALIEKSRQISMAYGQSLPDFMCTEVISRYRLGSATGMNLDWLPLDKLTVSLNYFQQHETHELKLLDGLPTDRKFNSADIGMTSTGEFGGILTSIFDPASQTSFQWKSSKDVRGRPVGVYDYQVQQVHSKYYVETGRPGKMRSAIVGFHGTLEIDRDSAEVIHLDHVTEHVPSDPEFKAVTEVDYREVEVAGNRYMLPVRSQMRMDRANSAMKIESEFRDYRKFEVGSKLDFSAEK
jgi:hypothetical protein